MKWKRGSEAMSQSALEAGMHGSAFDADGSLSLSQAPWGQMAALQDLQRPSDCLAPSVFGALEKMPSCPDMGKWRSGHEETDTHLVYPFSFETGCIDRRKRSGILQDSTKMLDVPGLGSRS